MQLLEGDVLARRDGTVVGLLQQARFPDLKTLERLRQIARGVDQGERLPLGLWRRPAAPPEESDAGCPCGATKRDPRRTIRTMWQDNGFGSFTSASRFCSAFDELRQYFRWRRGRRDHMRLAEQRRLFASRWRSLLLEMAAA